MDITHESEVREVLESFQPEVVIHTAAMTNVDQCELEKPACWQSNVEAVGYLLNACQATQSHLVHLSTDFIFDGSHGPLSEDELPAPVNYYGQSKLASEQMIMNSDLSWGIARTVLVYGVTPNMSRSNIILWVKENLEARESIQVVDDQWRTPTLAEDLAQGCFLMAKTKAKGIFNLSGKDLLTPYDMAMKVANFFNLDTSLISRANSGTFRQPALRPARTGFIIDKARNQLGYEPRSFDEGIAIVANQLG